MNVLKWKIQNWKNWISCLEVRRFGFDRGNKNSLKMVHVMSWSSSDSTSQTKMLDVLSLVWILLKRKTGGDLLSPRSKLIVNSHGEARFNEDQRRDYNKKRQRFHEARERKWPKSLCLHWYVVERLHKLDGTALFIKITKEKLWNLFISNLSSQSTSLRTCLGETAFSYMYLDVRSTWHW